VSSSFAGWFRSTRFRNAFPAKPKSAFLQRSWRAGSLTVLITKSLVEGKGEDMKMWLHKKKMVLIKNRIIAGALALVLTVGVGSYEILKPAAASAATPTPAAPALDDNSVSALTALDHAMEALAAHVTPAVVNVTVTSKNREQQMHVQGQSQGPDDQDQNQFQQFFGPFGCNFPQMRRGPQIEHGVGSGIIISPDGYIVTNNHVIEGETDIHVTLNDRRVLPAKLIGADPLTDLAVIKINASNLASIPWGDSSALKPGQTVLAFGNPYNFRFTVTRGIVSALNRTNPYSDDARKPGEFIQTDAAINPGNSGGPLVNTHGEVVGINTFLISPSGTFSGMGFAIPAQLAKPIINKLIKDGKIEHARIGVGITDVTPENAQFFHMSQANGAVISQASPGEKVTLGIERNGKPENITVTLEPMNQKGEQYASAGTPHGKARWG